MSVWIVCQGYQPSFGEPASAALFLIEGVPVEGDDEAKTAERTAAAKAVAVRIGATADTFFTVDFDAGVAVHVEAEPLVYGAHVVDIPAPIDGDGPPADTA